MIMKKICLLQFFIQVITCYEESYQKCDVIKKRPKNSYEKNQNLFKPCLLKIFDQTMQISETTVKHKEKNTFQISKHFCLVYKLFAPYSWSLSNFCQK